MSLSITVRVVVNTSSLSTALSLSVVSIETLTHPKMVIPYFSESGDILCPITKGD